MNLSPATMMAQLKALEELYQTRLFNRSTRALALTRAGEEFYHAALRVLEEMARVESRLMQKEGGSAAACGFPHRRILAASTCHRHCWTSVGPILE